MEPSWLKREEKGDSKKPEIEVKKHFRFYRNGKEKGKHFKEIGIKTFEFSVILIGIYK